MSSIVILLITNIVTLSFFWAMKKEIPGPPSRDHEKGGGMENFVTREFGFDSIQAKQYYDLRKKYFKQQKPLMDDVRKKKRIFFDHLRDETIDSAAIKSQAQEIADMQADLDLKTFYHFRQLRTISRPDQLSKFDEFSREIVWRITDGRRPPPRPTNNSDTTRNNHTSPK